MIDVNSLKKEIERSGKDNRTVLYIKEGQKRKVRFLDDFQKGTTVKFHDSYKLSVNIPCQEVYGRACKYCDNEDLRTRNQYIWSVYDYESKERKLLIAPVNNCSPVPALSAIYDEYGNITDRDYVIKRIGKGQDTTYTILPMAEQPFSQKKVKPFTEKEILSLIDKIYHDDDADEEEEKPKSNRSKGAKGAMNEPGEDMDDWEEDEEKEKPDYSNMKASELYKLCKKRDIDCKPRQPKDYYIDLLEDADEWGEEDELPFS